MYTFFKNAANTARELLRKGIVDNHSRENTVIDAQLETLNEMNADNHLFCRVNEYAEQFSTMGHERAKTLLQSDEDRESEEQVAAEAGFNQAYRNV